MRRDQDMDSSNSAPWFLTVIRTQGMRLMRPDREWRPIVTIDVRDVRSPPYPQHDNEDDSPTDRPHAFETLMGVDGQNPNIKDGLYIPGPVYSATPPSVSTSLSTSSSASSSTLTLNSSTRPSPALNTRVAFGVWFTPPAHGKRKAKTKKRVLVGSAELWVRDLVKMWQQERGKGKGALYLRLTCHSPTKGTASSRNGAIIAVRLRPPSAPSPSALDPSGTESAVEENDGPSIADEHSEAEDRHEEDVSDAGYPEQDIAEKASATVPDTAPSISISEEEPVTITATSVTSSDSESSDDPIPTPEPKQVPQGLRRRRKQRVKVIGYTVDSDACPQSPSSGYGPGSGSEIEDEREKERLRFLDQWCRDESVDTDADATLRDGEEGEGESRMVAEESVGWISASLLPQHTLSAGPSRGGAGVLENEVAAAWRAQVRSNSTGVVGGDEEKVALPAYTERVEVQDPDALTLPERVLATFTLYAALRAAQVDSEFEAVFARLQMEWGYVGGLLVALAAVNTAVLSISPDAIFTVHAYARGAVAASSVASGLGIACDAWFLLRYGWAEVGVVRLRALDVFNTYFFFALSARTPSMCMFTAALSLMAFLALVAFDAWPGGALVVCGLVGAVMGLQFLVWGAVWLGKGVRGGVRGVGRGVRGVAGAVGVGRGRERAGVGVNLARGEKGGR